MEVQVAHLSKMYGGHTVVNDVSFSVAEGKTLILLGTSGSGKTTCLKMINRLVEPHAGSIRLGGEDALALDPVALRRQIGYVIQEVGLFPHLTVADNIGVVPRLLGWPAARRQARCAELMQLLGLDAGLASRKPAQLSGGQQQRVGIARALAAKPGLMLLDEPFGALDPITRAHIQQEFLTLAELQAPTKVMVTHDVMEAVRLGDQIVLMDQGRVQQLGSPRELLFTPANAFVRQFFDEQRFALQLEIVTVADVFHHLPRVQEGGPEPFNLEPQMTLGQVLQQWAREPWPMAVTMDGVCRVITTSAELLAAFERTVEAWRT